MLLTQHICSLSRHMGSQAAQAKCRLRRRLVFFTHMSDHKLANPRYRAFHAAYAAYLLVIAQKPNAAFGVAWFLLRLYCSMGDMDFSITTGYSKGKYGEKL